MPSCPICRAPNPPAVLRCIQCGADFHDPDVIALAPGDSTELPAASLGEAGALASDRFMGISLTGLLEGRALATLGLLGGVALVAAFLAPVSADYTAWIMPWTAAKDGPALALVYPLLAAAAGFVAFATGRLEPWIRAALLCGLGLAGIFFTLTPLGGYAAGPIDLMVVFTAGMLLCGVAVTLRMYYPQLMESRHLLAAGAGVVLLGMLLPLTDVRDHLPAEFAWRMFRDTDAAASASALSAYLDGSGTDAMVQLVSWWGLLPVVLVPAALALAWSRPGGVWDRGSTGLRPIAWALVLFVPLTWFLYLFNLMGWDDLQWVRYKGQAARFEDFTMTVTVGRAKVAVAATVYALWAVFGSVVLYARLRLRSRTSP